MSTIVDSSLPVKVCGGCWFDSQHVKFVYVNHVEIFTCRAHSNSSEAPIKSKVAPVIYSPPFKAALKLQAKPGQI